MKPLFSRPFVADGRDTTSTPKAGRPIRHRKANRRQTDELRHESLEQRAMLAIVTAGGGPISDYLVVASNNATDVYIQQHAGQKLLISDESSFGPGLTETAVPDILYVTNGARGTGPGAMLPGNNTNYQSDPVLSTQTWFTLNSTNILAPAYAVYANGSPNAGQRIERDPNGYFPSERYQVTNPIRLSVAYDGATWDCEVDPDGGIASRIRAGGNQNPSSVPKTGPESGGMDYRGRGALFMNWSLSVATVNHPAAPAIPAPPQILGITYFIPNGPDTIANSETGLLPTPGIARTTSDLPYSAIASMAYTFSIPSSVYGSGLSRGVIPGTFGCTVSIDGKTINVADDFTSGGKLYFNSSDALVVNPYVTVSGSYTSSGTSATVTLTFLGAPRGSAVLDKVGYLDYVEDQRPNSFTLFAGHDLTSQLQSDLLTSNSTINVDSSIAVRTTLTKAASNVEDIVLRATNVNVNSQIIATDTMRVGPSLKGSAIAETLRVNAAVAAPASFIFVVADDPQTTSLAGNPTLDPSFIGPDRGRIELSPSGSLAGSISATSSAIASPTALVLVWAAQADIISEGTIYGTKQTYLMNSGAGASAFAPYTFSTRSQTTGADTGLIRGDTVSITLGNDVPTPLDQSIAYNTVDLSTQVSSLRVRAGTQQQAATATAPPNPSDSGPFPYNLSIREKDDISIDAVAASGLPLSIQSGGNMRFTSALATASDVTLLANPSVDNSTTPATVSPSVLTVSAPLTTTKGKIRLEAGTVSLNNAVQVLDSDADPNRDDIWVTADSGDIQVLGLVSAKNRVKLEQTGASSSATRSYQSSRDPLPIPDNGPAISKTIQVADDFTFTDVNVVVDITHPYVGDLALALISPDGRKFWLAQQVGGRGAGFTSTTFDSEAATAISAGSAPFTGSFRPRDSLTPLYGGSALGIWKLEVQDKTARDTGTLDGFTLQFTVGVGTNGKVSGPGRIQADSLLVNVGGAIGNPSLLPTDTNFYLRTDVNTLSGIAGAGAAIDELNDINIVSLRAPGVVSIRANGSDRARYDVNTGTFVTAALKANLVDVTGLDLAAPNGSVDVLFDTSKTIQLGNEAGLRFGKFLNSVAAGSVTIRSTAGSIDVLDAPVAGGNARTVRFVTPAKLSTANNSVSLSGVAYAVGTPGIYASTLKGNGNLAAWLGATGVNTIALGDRILVKNEVGTAANRNGVYTLTTFTGNSWTLTRAADSDTGDELPGNTYVRQESDANSVWQAGYAPFVNGNVTNASGLAVVSSLESTAGLQPGMVVVGNGIAPGSVIASINTLSQITLSKAATATGSNIQLKVLPTIQVSGTTTGGSSDVTNLFTTSALRVGMLVFGAGIPDGTVIESINTSSRTVTLSNAASSGATRNLQFIAPAAMRLGDLANGGSTVSNLVSTEGLQVGMVVVGDGIPYNTTITQIIDGSSVMLSNSATVDVVAGEVRFLSLLPPVIGVTPLTFTQKAIATDIGSNDPNDRVTFVVSTAGDTNSSAGSLGKMIALRQQNVAKTGNNLKDQAMDFKFSEAVRTPIRLTQELPEITKFFTIDGGVANRYDIAAINVPNQTNPVIDGSRITLTRAGRTLTANDVADGLKIRGPGANGTIVSNLTIGGFSRQSPAGALGSAINVSGASGVLINQVTVGMNETGARLASQIGVRFGDSSGGGTVLNSKIYSAINSGVLVDNTSTGVTVVGSTVGAAGLENNIGVNFAGGTNYLGVDAIAPITSASFTRVDNTRFTLPSSSAAVGRLVSGLSLLGTQLIPTDPTRPVQVFNVSKPVNGAVTVTITGGRVAGSGLVDFGNVAYTEMAKLRVDGTFTDGKTVVMPAAGMLGRENMFLGQAVRGIGIAAGATVDRVVIDGNGVATLTLSKPVTRTGLVQLSFTVGSRNLVQANRFGVVLAYSNSIMINTTVSGSTFDGVQIVGTGTHSIGTSTSRGLTSNYIYGNGGWGIYQTDAALDTKKVTVRGNYLGTTSGPTVPASMWNMKGSIGHKANNLEQAFAGLNPNQQTGIDANGNMQAVKQQASSNKITYGWRSS